MLKIQEIKSFIDNDYQSKKKKQARTGARYYEGLHDIKDYKVLFVNASGDLEEDIFKSNIKISHPFFTELVDQQVQYMLSSKDGFVFSDDTKLQAELNTYFNDNEDFLAELYDILNDCIVKGFGYAYAYKNADNKLAFQAADSLGVVEVKAKETSDNTDYVIYYYTEYSQGKKINRIQVWDRVSTGYYKQVDDGEIIPDDQQIPNPRPHIVYTDSAGEKFGNSFGFIPFFRIDNGKKQFSGLKPIKPIIDDYDLMSCGLSNNIQDAGEQIFVVSGFDGDNLDELMFNLKNKKHIGVDTEGSVDVKTIEIPYEARKIKLELDEKNIYRFGMGFNAAQLGDGNITNIVIKSRYALLDLKCNKLEIRLKQFLRKIIQIVLDEINTENETDYQQKDIYFNFKREIITNASDNAQIELTDAQKQHVMINTLLDAASRLDDETIAKSICDILELDYEELKDKLPKPDENDPYSAITTLNGGESNNE